MKKKKKKLHYLFVNFFKSDKVNITYADSIKFRLLKVLVYLHNLYPSDGWNQFYNDPNGKK